VRDVYVDGELIVSDGAHRAFDRLSVVDGARIALGRVLKTAGLEEYMATRGTWTWE
jgi:hypothetical protein